MLGTVSWNPYLHQVVYLKHSCLFYALLWQEKWTQLFKSPLISQISMAIPVTLLCTCPALQTSLFHTGVKAPPHLPPTLRVMSVWWVWGCHVSAPSLSPSLLVCGDLWPWGIPLGHGACFMPKDTPHKVCNDPNGKPQKSLEHTRFSFLWGSTERLGKEVLN